MTKHLIAIDLGDDGYAWAVPDWISFTRWVFAERA